MNGRLRRLVATRRASVWTSGLLGAATPAEVAAAGRTAAQCITVTEAFCVPNHPGGVLLMELDVGIPEGNVTVAGSCARGAFVVRGLSFSVDFDGQIRARVERGASSLASSDAMQIRKPQGDAPFPVRVDAVLRRFLGMGPMLPVGLRTAPPPPTGSCDGQPLTIAAGGDGNDTINGTAGDDVISGRATTGSLGWWGTFKSCGEIRRRPHRRWAGRRPHLHRQRLIRTCAARRGVRGRGASTSWSGPPDARSCSVDPTTTSCAGSGEG